MAVTVRKRGVADSELVFKEDLLGAKDGANLVFTTPDKFRRLMGFFRNGVAQDPPEDFTLAESGGVGTGYDTFTILGPAPDAAEKLQADYIK